MLAKVTDLIEHLVVYPDRMRRNFELTGGLVYSQRLLLALVEKGAQRKESYEAVQRNAMVSWRTLLLVLDRFLGNRRAGRGRSGEASRGTRSTARWPSLRSTRSGGSKTPRFGLFV